MSINISKYPNINTLWGSLIIEELVRNGVEYFCIAPGSRSTPLTAAAALNKNAKTFVHFDERGLAFHALGYVSATQKPAVLICTSGTAVANFLPAIIETSKKKLPLIVLTADRPPELQKTGADQTIEQNGIFGKYAKWDHTFPCPTTDIKPEYILTTIDQAVHLAKSGMPGVVHLNFMCREPLAPIGKRKDYSSYLKDLDSWHKSGKPFTIYLATKLNVGSELRDIATILSKSKNGLIVVGKLSGQKEQEAVQKLAQKLFWPIFPDITSGLRLGDRNGQVIHYFDQILLKNSLKFDCILHFGGRMTSKRYHQFIQTERPSNYIMVLAHPLRNDPFHLVTQRIQCSVKEFCNVIVPWVETNRSNPTMSKLQTISQRIGDMLDTEKGLSEITLPRIITRLIPKDSGLFLASSMPIRDMDMFAAHDGVPVIVGSNRGTSGIDGTIASAVGFAKGLARPTTLVIGDLAFLHDLNSLAMVKELKFPLAIVVVNNNGGGIFNFLPITERKDILEKYFSTPHHLSFAAAGELFKLEYVAVDTELEFSRACENVFHSQKSTIIEIKSNCDDNFSLHRNLQKLILSNL